LKDYPAIAAQIEKMAAHRQTNKETNPNRTTHQERAKPSLEKYVTEAWDEPGGQSS
jgi:hypothetical protein